MSNHEFEVARAAAFFVLESACLNERAWSVQGFGMMRCYWGKKKQFRFNIWDSSLSVPSVSIIHDHPWDFRSQVLGGIFYNQRYDIGNGNPYNRLRIQTGEGGGPVGIPDVVHMSARRMESYFPGDTYEQRHDEVHASYYQDGTVTVNDRRPRPDSEHANVFWHGTGGWVDAMPRPATFDEIKRVTTRALEKLYP